MENPYCGCKLARALLTAGLLVAAAAALEPDQGGWGGDATRVLAYTAAGVLHQRERA